jgi:hypothetical protein
MTDFSTDANVSLCVPLRHQSWTELAQALDQIMTHRLQLMAQGSIIKQKASHIFQET